MPNSPIRRFENCYMPPKKFAWRFDNLKPTESNDNRSSQKLENCSPVKEDQHNRMGLMFEGEMKSKPPVDHTSHAEKPQSSATMHSSLDDAPLDFSVRNHVRAASNGLPDSGDEEMRDERLGHPMNHFTYSDYIKSLPRGPLMAFPGMSRNRNSSPSGSNGVPGIWFTRDDSWNEHHDAGPCNGNQSSSEKESCENRNECKTSVSVNSGMNGCANASCRNSPERSLPAENGPSPNPSILQGMLATKNGNMNKISSRVQNIHISTTTEPLPQGNTSELVPAVSPEMAAANQSILPHLLHPVNNFPLPLTTFPFINGMGYVRPAVLSPNLLAQASTTSVLQELTQRRARRRKSEERPFKSYPIDVLEEKLQSVSANAYAYGLEHSKRVLSNGVTPRSPPSDPGRTSNVSESPERANGAINPQPSPEINVDDNPTNAECSGDSNDYLPPTRTETAETTSCTNGRKRKPTADGEKDDAYWDRRRKNNLAAKRSREARRRKEDAIANMAIIYETQNIELQQNVATLTYKLNEASVQLSRVLREHENLTIQNNILQERLSQKRCGHCGTQLPSVN